MKKYFKELKDKKFIYSILLFLGGQCLTYALIKVFQTRQYTFSFAIDSKIPLIPPFIIIYNMFYPFLFFVFYYLYKKDKKTYDKGIITATLGYLLCDVIFIIYPVLMTRPDISNVQTDWFTNLVLQITYKMDNPSINCFPSIHCLFCFQAIYSVWRSKNISIKYKLGIGFIAGSIIASVLLVRQHYVVDMVAALIVSITCNLLIESIYNRIKKNK